MSEDPATPSPAVRRRRRIARVIALVAALVCIVTAFRLGFVDITEHPGTVGVGITAAVVFVLAFPFTGIARSGPRGPTDDRP